MYRILLNKVSFSLSKFDQHIRIMQLPKTATIKDVKPKFIELAKRYHPDTG
jgi:curved DNA-binding protein CbpA